MNAIDVHAATLADVPEIAPLFDEYRSWYGETSDRDGAVNFLTQRLRNNEATVFFATLNQRPVGFVQLYPLFSSASMAPIWLLNDLYVSETARGHGAGSVLLEAAAEFGRQMGAARLELEVEISNPAAQAIYEKHGWLRNQTHHFYSLTLAD